MVVCILNLEKNHPNTKTFTAAQAGVPLQKRERENISHRIRDSKFSKKHQTQAIYFLAHSRNWCAKVHIGIEVADPRNNSFGPRRVDTDL